MVKKTRSKRLGCYFYKSNVLDASFAKTLFGQVKMQFSPWGRGSASWMARAKNGLEKAKKSPGIEVSNRGCRRGHGRNEKYHTRDPDH
jgi:basic membrane lipoprotein Med (substrate-binding protein (PBP1-ABC) superfamily)